MPFGLPEYDAVFSAFVQESVNSLARAQSPLLGQIEARESVGAVSSVVDRRGEPPIELPSESIGFGVTMDVRAVRDGNFEALIIELDAAAEELGRGLVEMFVRTMNTVTEATGNVVNAGGKPFSFEVFFEMLDRIEWGLTEDDELSLPSVVMHPDLAKKLPELTPEQDAALEALKKRKHEELLARRRRRRIS